MRNIFLPLTFLVLLSCGKKSDLSYEDNSHTSFPIEEAVSFSQLKADILSPNCVRCHSSASTEAGLKSWVVAGNPDASPLFLRSEDGSMPKDAAPLSTRDLQEIRAYIANLKPSTPTPTPSPTPSAGVTFSQIKSAVLTPYSCTSCHSMSTESGVARYINVSSPDRSTLYTSVKSGSMPKGSTKVPADKQALLLQYVRDYAAAH